MSPDLVPGDAGRTPDAADRAIRDAAPGIAVLELDAAEVRTEGTTILTGVNWRVERGQHWVVMGPNGGGKSTLLRLASLGLHPSSGTVRILGHELGRVDVRPLRARIGLASSSLAEQLRPSLSAEEVVRCGRFGALEPWWHRYEPADTRRAEQLLGQVGLDGYAGRRMGSLSSGERQRVLLARTLMPSPELVLLDEPTANLDFGGREDLIDALSALAATPDAPPTVLVIHRVEDIPATTTHLLALGRGTVVAQGPVEATLRPELLSELFGLSVRLERTGRRWTAYRDPSTPSWSEMTFSKG